MEMSSKTQNNPSIRFKGFTDAWEQRELKEILKVNSGRDYKHLGSGSIPVYGTGGYMLSVNDKLSDKDAIGIGRKGTIDKPQYLKAPFWTVDTLFFMIPLNNFDLQFLYTMTQKINWKKMDESTGVPSLSKAVIEKVNQNIPSYQEQIKIGGFFKQLDNTIALHQRKLTLFNQLKETYLKQMFPQNEENMPVLRFADFSEPWEQRKLGDTVQITMGQSPNGENYTDNPRDHILVQGNADMKNGRVCPRVWTTQVTKKADPEDIILSVRAPVGDVGRTDYAVVLGRGVAGIKGNAFIFQTLSRMKEQGFWTRYSSGSTFESINSADLKDAFIQICHIEEQTKIGDFFTKLDDTIALHQSKLQKLAELKKTLLAKMLV